MTVISHACMHVCRGIYMSITQVLVYGFLEHVSITLIDKTDPSDLLKREDYRRQTLSTVTPYGLNTENRF